MSEKHKQTNTRYVYETLTPHGNKVENCLDLDQIPHRAIFILISVNVQSLISMGLISTVNVIGYKSYGRPTYRPTDLHVQSNMTLLLRMEIIKI